MKGPRAIEALSLFTPSGEHGTARANAARKMFSLCYDPRAMAPARIKRNVPGAIIAERRLLAIRSALGALPPGLRRSVRTLLRFLEARLGDLVDAAETVTGRRDPLMPPRRMIGVGSNSIIKSDYRAIGRELVDLAVRLADLRPDDAILEVGSGTGRIAATLTPILSPTGQFEGFDIVGECVRWCQANITPRFPRLRFTHADVFNAAYNPGGTHGAGTYRFPYDDATFDVAMATSVLTHMYRDDAAHYLREIARVLKPGGRTFITHFLWTPESQTAQQEGRSAMRFLFPVPDGVTIDAAEPEAAIAINLDAVRADYDQAGLVLDPVCFGRWRGQMDGVHFQDIVVARKS